MEYSYSRPASSPSYQTAPPSRVTPVGASSFSGPKGGGGIFPFIPIPGQSSPDATSSAGENAAAQSQSMSAINASMSQIRQLNQAAQPQLQPQQNGLRIESSIVKNGLNRINSQMAEEPKLPNVTSSTNSLDRLLGRESGGYGQKADVVYGTHGSDFLYDAVIDGGGADVLPDRIISGSGADRIQDRIISGSGTDEIRYRSFQDVESSLPSDSVSFRVAGQDPAVSASETVEKPLVTRGQMSFQDVQNLPVPDTSAFQKPVQQSGLSRFWDYASRYQQDKMENPLREIGIQTGASLLAAPILAGMAPAAVTSAVAPVANNIVRLIPQTGQAVQSAATQAVSQGNNIVNFADYARQAGTLAAGVAGAVALPAAAQTVGWNPQTQTYSSSQVRGRQ